MHFVGLVAFWLQSMDKSFAKHNGLNFAQRCVPALSVIITTIYEVFDLMNHSIQNEVVHHESISQIWWDDSIPHISTKQLTMRNEVVMD
jgi:hypothetical protein